jgi:hypothetical protein
VTTLKRDDRVRVTAMNRVSGYHPGDRGTVIWGPYSSACSKETFFVVSMDKAAIVCTEAVFLANEIEPDV